MPIRDTVFSLIPFISLLCNVFLFFTLLTAKKNAVIYSFMALLISFVMWTCGSYFCRMELYPGTYFWWQVSVTGICLVPYLYYLLACTYTNERSTFLKLLWGFVTILLVVMNLLDLFMSHPVISVENGERVLHYSAYPLAVFPLIAAVLIFITAGRLMSRNLKNGSMHFSQFKPLILGVAIMFAGIVLDVCVTTGTLPLDTLSVSIHAVCIYYALYKKRFYALSQITSKGSTYLISVIITTLILVNLFNDVDRFFGAFLGQYAQYRSMAIAILFSLLAILIFSLLNALHKSLFIKDQIERENKLRTFSLAINKTLQLTEIVVTYLDFLRDTIPAVQIHVCLHAPDDHCYRSMADYSSLNKRFSLGDDNSLVKWMQENNRAILYTEFMQTTNFRSMWEIEKQTLQSLGAILILPIKCDDTLVGLTFLSEKINRRSYTYDEINFLESVVSIVSIAVKNANLYETIHREALRDSLTGLYNRRHFNKQLEEDFQRSRSHSIAAILFNLDDFRLYNELYGSGEGDRVLQHFAQILQKVISNRGTVARYGGKEFAVILPFCGAAAAEDIAKQVQEDFKTYLNQTNGSTQKFLTFSAGICAYPTSAANPDQLLSYANLAVYTVKKNGKNRIMTYTRTTGADDPLTAKSKASIVQEYTSTIYALTAAIDAKDHYTFSHSQCVSSYAAQLASASGLSEEHVEIIRQAGLLHDIGKIGIPDSILTKEGKLSPEEFKIMRQHVERSIEMIRHLPSLDYVIPVVLSHHERFDGKGYPRGIAGESIPIGARCLNIVDSFDAMVSRRSYKEVMPVESALNEIRCNLGKQFDPELGLLFISLVENEQIKIVSY